MPFKSATQKRFMSMSASPAGRKALKKYGKKPAPVSVAKKFIAHGKGGK
jgi:hypothetical protein